MSDIRGNEGQVLSPREMASKIAELYGCLVIDVVCTIDVVEEMLQRDREAVLGSVVKHLLARASEYRKADDANAAFLLTSEAQHLMETGYTALVSTS